MLSHPVDGIVKRRDSTKLTDLSLSEFKSFLIVMEYVSSGDLLTFMKKPPFDYSNEMALDITLQLLMDISKPLDYYNDKVKYFHADVKPENVLVSYKNSTSKSNIKFHLADFSCSISIPEFVIGEVGGTYNWVCCVQLFFCGDCFSCLC